MKAGVNYAGGNSDMKENCPWEDMPWNPPAKLEDGVGRSTFLGVTVVSKDAGYMKFQFNGFLHKSYAMYNSACWEMFVKTGNTSEERGKCSNLQSPQELEDEPFRD